MRRAVWAGLVIGCHVVAHFGVALRHGLGCVALLCDVLPERPWRNATHRNAPQR
jgi:hypothetical protein